MCLDYRRTVSLHPPDPGRGDFLTVTEDMELVSVVIRLFHDAEHLAFKRLAGIMDLKLSRLVAFKMFDRISIKHEPHVLDVVCMVAVIKAGGTHCD